MSKQVVEFLEQNNICHECTAYTLEHNSTVKNKFNCTIV